ncbi:transporter substrate-binding domain-containing protein [Acrocarpospora macrocephala]|uniref:transporter substrate-binding domain-containing protein n=1 Tax=Acrocarpospora macrocephala TaxID=150177 RepID=UPI0014794D70|nr:transporter substrate-binding domain-containing protein [Acrocarpospora macrocephala]
MTGLRRRTRAAVAVLILTCTTACDASSGYPSLVNRATLRIAVSASLPGLSEFADHHRSGFDIDVATYVATELGARRIEWHEVVPRARERVLRDGGVDLVVASYIMNENRLDVVSFAGPYLMVGQDILIRTADMGKIAGVDDLKDRQTCVSEGSTSAQRLVQRFGTAWDEPAHLIRLDNTGACVERLLTGQLDAVSTGNSILVGYAAQHPGRLHLVGRPFTSEEVGIGLAKGNTADIPRINAILRQMIDKGAWAASIRRSLGTAADSFIDNQPKPP